MDDKLLKITFEYKIAQDYHVYSATGAIGGLNPKGQVIINFFNERSAIPKRQTYNVNPDGSLESSPIDEDRKEAVIRDVMFGISMTADTARSLAKWLTEKAEQYEDLIKKIQEKTDK